MSLLGETRAWKVIVEAVDGLVQRLRVHDAETHTLLTSLDSEGNKIGNLPFHDLDDAGSGVTYLGYSDSLDWYVVEMTEIGKDLELRYANVVNNPTRTTYALAWANRLTLIYDLIEDI